MTQKTTWFTIITLSRKEFIRHKPNLVRAIAVSLPFILVLSILQPVQAYSLSKTAILQPTVPSVTLQGSSFANGGDTFVPLFLFGISNAQDAKGFQFVFGQGSLLDQFNAYKKKQEEIKQQQIEAAKKAAAEEAAKEAAIKAAQELAAQQAAAKAAAEAAEQARIARMNQEQHNAYEASQGVAVGFTQGNDYAWGNCTWYVANRRPVPASLGNARDWYYNAQSLGMLVGDTPYAGAIAWFHPYSGTLGHVAYVESVNSDGTFVISEMNVEGLDVTDTRTITDTSAWSFIY